MIRDHKAHHAKHRVKRNAQSAKWRLNNLEYHRKIARDTAARMRKNDPLRYLVKKAKYRAKELEVPFSIAAADLTMPLVCPLLGIWLAQSVGKVGPHSPTIDRIEPAKGYVPGNVWIISARANTAKSDLTLDEFLRMTDNMRRLLTKASY